MVVRRFTPTGARFADEDHQRRFGDLRYKAFNAREHGAIGVLIVELARAPDWRNVARRSPAARPQGRFPGRRRPAGDGAEALGRHRSFRRRARWRRWSPSCTSRRRRPCNVLGWVRAGGQQKRPEVLVVGAHFDHLGLGGHRGSLAPTRRSRTTAPTTTPRAPPPFSRSPACCRPAAASSERDVLIAAFSGEESGLLGSAALRPPAHRRP